MSEALYGSDLLAHLSAVSGAASVVPIHPSYLPIPPLTLVHALAVSHNTLLLSGYVSHNRGKINLATSLAFNQLLLFGPLSVIAAMLAQPCPLLIAPEFILIYGGVHLFNILSGLGPTIVGLSGVGGIGLLIDSVYLLADAFARSDGMAVLGVETVKAHPNPLISSSPWAILLIGWAVGVGSILMLGMISFERLDWTFRTPYWLTTPSSLLSADFLSSFLATLVYYVTTSPEGLAALHRPAMVVMGSPVLPSVQPFVLPVLPYFVAVSSSTLAQLQIQPRGKASVAPGAATSMALLSSGEARAIGALIVLTFSLGRRLKNAVLASMVKSTSSKSGITATPTSNGAPSSAIKSPPVTHAKGSTTPRKRK